MILKNSFDNLSEEDIKLLDSYFDSMDYESSSHTFLSNYIWRNTHKISWEIIDGYLFISSLDDEEPEKGKYFISMPLTNTGEYDLATLKTSIEKACLRLKQNNQDPILTLVPGSAAEILKKIYGDQIICEHMRDEDDYIYLRSDLETLAGRKFHQKKNHLNYFLANYEYSYEEITPEMNEEIMNFVIAKNEYILKDTPEDFKEILEMENTATSELLNFIGTRSFGGIIRIDGEMKAVTIGEFSRTTSKETVVVHVEKADDRIKGLYQAINNEFVKHLPAETKYVNREEDMGLDYLRQAKEGYRPIKMGEKYAVKFIK